MLRVMLACGLLVLGSAHAATPATEALLGEYRSAGAAPADADKGKQLWSQESRHAGEPRSCTSCHTADLRKTGKHASTGKPIDPVAPSANPEALTDTANIEKWFGRNCKWTWGRVCTAEEKSHFLAFMQSQ